VWLGLGQGGGSRRADGVDLPAQLLDVGVVGGGLAAGDVEGQQREDGGRGGEGGVDLAALAAAELAEGGEGGAVVDGEPRPGLDRRDLACWGVTIYLIGVRAGLLSI
jgi:hypothetical protein